MALRIVKSSDPLTVKQIVTVVYAAPGIGKSTLAFTAAAPLLLDFDKGAYRAANRGDSVQPESWADVAAITADDLKPYRTLVFDTAGRALDMLSVDITTRNPKHGNGGALSLQGYGELKSRFAAYLNLVRSFGLDVVLLVHMDEQRRGDDLIERLDMQGSSKNEVYKSADLMGRLRVKQGGGWLLDFSPSDTAFGKNPARFDVLSVPNVADNPHFLADVIQQAKDAMNVMTAEQKGKADVLAEWRAKFEKAETPAELSAFVALTAEEEANVKRLLLSVGKAKAWDFDAKDKVFVDPKAPSTNVSEQQQALVGA